MKEKNSENIDDIDCYSCNDQGTMYYGDGVHGPCIMCEINNDIEQKAYKKGVLS